MIRWAKLGSLGQHAHYPLGRDPPSGCTAPTGSYASDPIGHETAELFVGASDAGSGWRCYGYDARGRTDQSTLTVTTPDGHTVAQTVNMTYDDQNDVTSLVYPDGEVLTSNYDSNGRFQSAYFGTSSTPDPVQFLVGQTTYANDGLLSSIALGGSGPKASTPTAVFTLNQGYDSIQRAVSTSATEGSTTLFSQTRTYDNTGNVLGLATSTLSSSGATVTENEAFCYDALSRLVWAGNGGTPTGGDHCMSAPSSNGVTGYSQAYSYDSLDRLTSGSAGSYTYGDNTHVHAATGLSNVPNQYAAYDAMGNMTCRNTDATGAQTCSGGSPTGATMSYDVKGELVSWTAPSGTSASETYLYDADGNQVLTTSSQNGTPTDTISFDKLHRNGDFRWLDHHDEVLQHQRATAGRARRWVNHRLPGQRPAGQPGAGHQQRGQRHRRAALRAVRADELLLGQHAHRPQLYRPAPGQPERPALLQFPLVRSIQRAVCPYRHQADQRAGLQPLHLR